MAKQVIHISDVEAAQDFSELLAHVLAGGEVIIERDHYPVAILRPAAGQIDWSECAEVEMTSERVGGRPTIKNTRMPVEDVVANYEYGVSIEEIAEQFGIKPEIIRNVLSYAERHNGLARSL